MRYINVDDDFVGKILAANQLAASEGLNESQEVEVVEEGYADEDHVCPLCESELEHPIPEENMQECVDFILGTINEALEMEGEYLEESEDEDFEEDLDEAEEEDEDKDEDKDDDDKPAFMKKKDKKKD